jgi:uncharacterized protein (TIGR02118 family)
MAKMIVIYKTPKDVKAFNQHYFEVHLPLAKKLPGLKKYEVSQGPVVDLGGARDTYLVGTLEFESLAAIRTAFASEVGQACAKDREIYAPNDEDFQMFLLDDKPM